MAQCLVSQVILCISAAAEAEKRICMRSQDNKYPSSEGSGAESCVALMETLIPADGMRHKVLWAREFKQVTAYLLYFSCLSKYVPNNI